MKIINQSISNGPERDLNKVEQNNFTQKTESDSPQDKVTIIRIVYGTDKPKDGSFEVEEEEFLKFIKSDASLKNINLVQRMYAPNEFLLWTGESTATDYAVSNKLNQATKSSEELNDKFAKEARCGLLPNGAVNELRSASAKEEYKSFLLNAIEKYPADEYIILISGHCHCITPNFQGLAEAMKEVKDETLKKKFGLLTFESCVMNRACVADEFSDSTSIQFGSEELFYPDSWSFEKFINNFEETYKGNDEDIRKFVKNEVMNSKQANMSALDLDQIKLFENGAKKLKEHITEKIKDKTTLAKLYEIIEQSQHFAVSLNGSLNNGLVDAYDFAKNIASEPYFLQNDKELVEVASEFLKTSEKFVIANKNRKLDAPDDEFLMETSKACGVGLDLPTFGYNPITGLTFLDSKFDRNTGWKELTDYLEKKAIKL
jgi:ribosomal protein S15P/S13E